MSAYRRIRDVTCRSYSRKDSQPLRITQTNHNKYGYNFLAEELVLGDPVVPEPSAEEEDSIFAEAEVIDAVTPTPPTDTNTNVEVASLSVQSPTQQVGLTPVELQPVLKTEEKSSEPVALEEEQEAFENKEEPTLIEETLIDEEALEGEVSANETTVEETPVEVAPQPEISDPAAEEDQNKLDQYFDDLLSQCENEVEETASSLLEEPAIPSAPKMAGETTAPFLKGHIFKK